MINIVEENELAARNDSVRNRNYAIILIAMHHFDISSNIK